ncbi:MAG: response regulator [Candidatus Omnitrophica bacterium]|nr:response regulator [Candidatus Omnitrophota bacterium]
MKTSVVLVVDDEEGILDSSVKYLELEGYEVHGAKNAEEAFEALERHRPPVLVLDWNLKERFTGLDVLRRALELIPNVQCAILTGHSERHLREWFYEAGAKTVIEKPVTVERLREIVEALADK